MAAAKAFFAARDDSRADVAYGMLDDLNRDQPRKAFAADLVRFNKTVGAVKERRIIKVTWTKDPAEARAPGIYVAIDVAARFRGADRYCGYVVLYQSPSGGDFHVMRTEENFIDNRSAERILAHQGRAILDAAWRSLSGNCPGGA